MTKVIGLGIDHGFGNIKTANSIFTAGVSAFSSEPEVLTRVVQYQDKFYHVGGVRMAVKDSKVADDDYYILTLAGIAEELKFRGLQQATIMLGAGLPLVRVGAEKQAFKEYLLRDKNVTFSYEGIPYKVVLEGVEIFPQGYAAILRHMSEIPTPSLIMEWGSWTVELIYLEEYVPILKRCDSLPFGFIRCQTTINKELMRQYNVQAEQKNIENIMLGTGVTMQEKYQRLIKEEIRSYIKTVFGKVKEMGFSLEMLPVVHMGGGASVVKRFGEYDPAMTKIIEGIHVNALAYEQLVNKKL